jgi:hypothetical protein
MSSYRDAPKGSETLEQIKGFAAEAEVAGDLAAAGGWKALWTRKLMEDGGADGNVDHEGFRASAEAIRGSVGGDGEAGGEEEAT